MRPQVRTVQVFAQEEAEAGRFRNLLDATYRLAQQTATLQGLTDGTLRLEAARVSAHTTWALMSWFCFRKSGNGTRCDPGRWLCQQYSMSSDPPGGPS